MNIAVFVSGRGSNLQAILNSNELKGLVEVVAVVSDKIKCAAFDIAMKNSIPRFSVSEKGREGTISYDQLRYELLLKKVELIVLAGFLKLIPADFIKSFRDKIINIHPALLPDFGGKGMYGHNVHEAVFNSHVKYSGPTVHFVNEEYDKGYIIVQEKIDISDAENPNEIAERVLKLEHKILPEVIKKFALKKISILNSKVILKE